MPYYPSEYDIDRFGCPQVHFDTLRERGRDFVFVVGHARSGTTILADWLNTDPATHIVYEDSPFLETHREDYRDWYNRLHSGHGTAHMKGYFWPSYGISQGRWSEYYVRALERFTRVGTKIALGPHDTLGHAESRLLDFFLSIFASSTYLITAREPWSCAESTLRILPSASMLDVADSIGRTIVICQRLAFSVGHCALVNHARLDHAHLQGLLARLQPQASPRGAFVSHDVTTRVGDAREQVHSRLDKEGLSRSTGRAVFAILEELHENLLVTFDGDTGALAPHVAPQQHMVAMEALLSRLGDAISSARVKADAA